MAFTWFPQPRCIKFKSKITPSNPVDIQNPHTHLFPPYLLTSGIDRMRRRPW